MRHTPCKKVYRTIDNGEGPRDREYTACEICGSEDMLIPATFDHYYSFGMRPRMHPFSMGLVLLLPLFVMLFPIANIFSTDVAHRGVWYGLLISILVFFIALYGGIFLWYVFQYGAWKKWAKLRGWKEPNRSERIKRGKEAQYAIALKQPRRR